MTALTLRRRALKHAKFNVGVKEVGGNNRGPKVDEIIKYAKGTLGEPWCVDGVIWCYGHSGSTVVKPGFPRAVRDMARRKGVVKVEGKAHSGNIVRFVFDHTGLLWYPCNAAGRRTLWSRATHIKTIEFNTGSVGAQSDSTAGDDGVAIKVRDRKLVRDYLRVLA